MVPDFRSPSHAFPQVNEQTSSRLDAFDNEWAVPPARKSDALPDRPQASTQPLRLIR
jgi:hypothetical protein